MKPATPWPARALLWPAVVSLAGVLVVAGFVALGVWQVERRAWKLDLIRRVTERTEAAEQAPPGPETWPRIGQSAEYRRVRAQGTYLPTQDVLVQAATVQGPGYWVLTPLRTAQGFLVLVNRGFVPMDQHDAATTRAPAGVVSISGLLRLTEPAGGFLHHNDPAAHRWYSRDVPAIADSLALHDLAPYFIDADARTAYAGVGPIPGLTVLRFPNNHMQYALTWFSLALMTLAALLWFWRQEWRQKRA